MKVLFFAFLISYVIAQRLIELAIAKSNEKWMRSKGAFEVGADIIHYGMRCTSHFSSSS